MKKCWLNQCTIFIYFIFMTLVFLTAFIFTRPNIDHRFKQVEDITFPTLWEYDYGNGQIGMTKLPNDLPESTSTTLYLTNTIPKLSMPTSFFFRARHTVVKITLDSEVIIDQTTTFPSDSFWSSVDGIYYHEIPLTPEDEGKKLVIESHSDVPRYLTKPGNIYLGDRGTFFITLFIEKGQTLVCAIALLVIASILFILWLLSTFVLKYQFKEVLCLGLFTLSISLWLFTESQCLQFFIRDTKKITLFAYEILMITPFPIALFFYYCSDRVLSKKHSQAAACIPLLTFIVNNGLHYCHILSLADSLIITQLMLAFETLFIAWIQITEIIYKRKHNNLHETIVWKIPLIGIGLLVPMATIEIYKYAFATTRYPNDGILISMGVIIYILSLTIDSVIRLAYSSIKLKQAAEMKTQFLANMSHDIRTPLNAILGFNEVILRISKEEKIKTYATNIQAAGKTLKDIINSILDITKIESGKLVIYETQYSTLRLLDNVISICESSAHKKGLKFITHIDEHLPETLNGDETHITQVLNNILSNAVKYTPSGSITFTVKLLSLQKESSICQIYFSVKDTGVGIKDEDKKRLFDKFERLDQDINYHVEGTGLGMSIVTQLLLAMDSKIELDSQYGVGSDFHFVLTQCVIDQTSMGDFNTRRQKFALENDPGIDFIAPNAQILIVDDVQINLDATCALLEPTKIQIDTALNGKTALAMIENKHYDIILMDHMMPDMDGIETTQKIRLLANEKNDPYYTNLPILALTANAMVGMKEVFLSSSMQDYISKPIDVTSLNLIIKKWLPKHLIETPPSLPASDMLSSTAVPWNIPISSLDLNIAKQFNTSLDMYKNNLKNYVEGFEETKNKLLQFQHMQDANGYCITIHGLKSTSKLIGAMTLSMQALQLEEACQSAEKEKVWEETTHFLSLYEKVIMEIKEYLDTDMPAPVLENLSYLEYDKLLLEIKTAADTFDMDAFILLEERLNNISVPPDKISDLNNIKQMVSNIAFTELATYLSHLSE